jgi:hypothetical protein
MPQDILTVELTRVEGERKTSLLFVHLLWKLVEHYPHA